MKMRLLIFMRGAGLVLALTAIVPSCKKDMSHSAPTSSTAVMNRPSLGTPRALANNWQLVWSDEFNGANVDQSKWNIDVGNPGVNNEK